MVASNDQNLSSLSCQLRIIKTKDIEVKSRNGGGLFVRYYLSAGNNKRIQMNSQEIPSTSHDLTWNESVSLECLGTEDSIKNLSQQSVVFELRWRDTTSFKNLLGKKSKSQLLGRTEVPWKTVFESPNMELENWVVMVPSNNKVKSARVVDHNHVKPAPSLLVSMKVGVQAPKMVEKKNKIKKKSWVDECGCSGHDHGVGACSCADYELFALVAAFEAL